MRFYIVVKLFAKIKLTITIKRKLFNTFLYISVLSSVVYFKMQIKARRGDVCLITI
jgi:hypothetical protein